MGKKVKVTRLVDVTEMGSLGGLATAAKRMEAERKAAASAAAKARWEKYYRDHPDKKPKNRRKRKTAVG
jgi:hypothetical protein